MNCEAIPSRAVARSTAALGGALLLAAGLLSLPAGAAAQAAKAATAAAPGADPRVGLRPGVENAGEAARNLELVAHRPKPEGFFDPNSVGNFAYANADLAFRGNYVFQGGYHGFQVWDISDPKNPKLRTAFACPGGQGDPSVYGNLLFYSVEETSGRVDCGGQGVADTVSAERFRGVRIFDISDLDHPKQVAAIQTCRGSHTHTLVPDPKDSGVLYVYVSETSVVRSGNELAGCSDKRPEEDPNTSLFRIDIIRVPLAAPQDAKIVNSPRLFADSAGNIAGLWKGGTHGEGTQNTYETNMCHDITVYPELGLAAGACSGNGILLDIRDPANPRRIAEVTDPNFAYWHSATFNNDGTKLLYTDEWGGGVGARCRESDPPKWGGNAIYTLANGKLTPASIYKLPAAQSATENCVAHNGSLVPVPGRDILVQAWYQGGISVVDFTDAAHPVEIAFFDRGPLNADTLMLGGYWSAYWYNGHIIGSEIARGLDVFELKPSAQLSQNEIDAAKLVEMDHFNPQLQGKLVWPAHFVVARAYLDQLGRNNGLAKNRLARVSSDLNKAEKLAGAKRKAALTKLAGELAKDARSAGDPDKVRALQATVSALADAAS
ncbi:MAG TPA: hypothetical protein VFS11_04185 [Gemmatimonadales bacterium]|nr:hypothetical protein [Gemmatimonadales bacterium]